MSSFESSPRECRSHAANPVTRCAGPVQPIGHPIRCSQKCGLQIIPLSVDPVPCSKVTRSGGKERDSVFVDCIRKPALICRTCVQTRAAELIPICFPLPLMVFARDTNFRLPLAIITSGKFPASLAVGVGQDEDAAAPMACARFSRCKQARFCFKAHARKLVRDFGKSQIEMTFDIFAKDPLRSDLVDDASDLRPEVTRILRSSSFSGSAEWLAWITGRDDMNAVAPRFAVEGSQIVPNRGLAQGRVFHPRHEGGRCMGFPLDISHSPVSGFCDVQAEIKSAISGAEREAAQVTFKCAGGM